MTTDVDFLPASYRGGTVRRRERRERLWLAIPVVVASIAVDVVLRIRVAGVREMARLAREHATFGTRLNEEAQELATKAATIRAEIESLAKPLDARRMTRLVDELLADRPDGVALHELSVHQQPWSSAAPTIDVAAHCADPEALKVYLAALRSADTLPQLSCERTDAQGDGKAFAFALKAKDPRRAR
ncbi:MAG: hypothetical protein JNK78_10305 [Planctomycetes bacterium]|nr:hypothetical protein [Planctomycetota bacterium]